MVKAGDYIRIFLGEPDRKGLANTSAIGLGWHRVLVAKSGSKWIHLVSPYNLGGAKIRVDALKQMKAEQIPLCRRWLRKTVRKATHAQHREPMRKQVLALLAPETKKETQSVLH